EARRLHDGLRRIDLGVTLGEAGQRLKPNGEYWLKGEAMLRERLGRFDEAFRNARAIADSCVLDLLYDTNTPRAEASFVGKDRLPGFPVPEGHTAFSFLYALCGEGAKIKYPRITRDVAKQLAHELDVIQYVYKKYGERYAAMVGNVVTYRARSASREVAKALGFRAETIDRMAKSIDQYHVDPRGMPTSAQHPAYHHTDRASEHGWEEPRAMPDTVADLVEVFNEKERARFPLFRELTLAIADFPRHLSIHTAGMLITALRLVDTVPIARATMPA